MDLPSPLPAVCNILPYLLSSTPIPNQLLATPAQQSHLYLSYNPSTPSYLQPFGTPDQVLVEQFEEVKECWGGGREQEFVERLNEDDANSRRVSWRIELDGEIRSRVDLTIGGHGGDVSLGITFLWEEKEEVGAAWGFLSLCRLPALDLQEEEAWHSSLSAAVAGLSTSIESERNTGSRAIPITTGGKENLRADGEGTTPGAYGAAEDFWEGWGNDDADTTTTATTNGENSGYDRYGGGENRDYRDRYKEEVKEAEVGGYWDRYGSVESGVGEGNVLTENVKVVHIENVAKAKGGAEEGVTEVLSRSITRSRRSSTIKAPATESFTDIPALSNATPVPTPIRSGLVASNGVLHPSSPKNTISTPMSSEPTITSATSSPRYTNNSNSLKPATLSTSSNSSVSFPSPPSSVTSSSKRLSRPHPPTSLPSSHHYSAFDAAELQAEKLADQAREMEEAVLMSMKGLFKVWCAGLGVSTLVGEKGKEAVEREKQRERERKWLELAGRAFEK